MTFEVARLLSRIENGSSMWRTRGVGSSVNILLIAPALILGLRLLAVYSALSTGWFDLRGAVMLACGLISLVLALTGWRLPGVPGFLAPALGLLTIGAGLALVWHTARGSEPILNLTLFRARVHTRCHYRAVEQPHHIHPAAIPAVVPGRVEQLG